VIMTLQLPFSVNIHKIIKHSSLKVTLDTHCNLTFNSKAMINTGVRNLLFSCFQLFSFRFLPWISSILYTCCVQVYKILSFFQALFSFFAWCNLTPVQNWIKIIAFLS
jgi:hypothetical protein